MAQLPRIYAPTPAQSVAAARGMPVSKIASMNGSIDESTSSNPAAFDTAFTLQENRRRDAGHEEQHRQNLPRQSGRFVVPTREFTSLMENYSGGATDSNDPDVRARRLGGIVTRAIRTYETNAKVIHGEADVTGTELSLRL